MLRVGTGPAAGLRWALWVVTAIVVVGSASPGLARHYYHRQGHGGEDSYNPPYASIVVDANTGAVLQSDSSDSPRHPASLKIGRAHV